MYKQLFYKGNRDKKLERTIQIRIIKTKKQNETKTQNKSHNYIRKKTMQLNHHDNHDNIKLEYR